MCANGLKGGHINKNCKTKIKCFKCKAEGHHTILCSPQSETQRYAPDASKEHSAAYSLETHTRLKLQPISSFTVLITIVQDNHSLKK